MIRTIFMGTPDFAETILTELSYTKDIEIVAVYTEPDKPRGRGMRMEPSPVKVWAAAHQWPIEQPPGFRKDPTNLEKLKAYRPDLIVVAAYGKILPKELIDIPKYGCVNVHASLLPKYRGASPIQYALLNNDTETGISLMRIDEGMDTGKVISEQSIVISQEDNFQSLSGKLALLGAKMIKDDLPKYLSAELKPRPQPEEGVSVTRLIKKTDGEIHWSTDSTEQIFGKIRAFTPWPGVYTFLTDGKRLLITRAHLANEEPFASSTDEFGKTPGVCGVLTPGVEENSGVFPADAKQLIIDRVKVEGKPEISWEAFLSGYRSRLPEKMREKLGLA